jgi:hypothetical protein
MKTAAGALGVIVFFLLAGIGGKACRDSQITDCHRQGGKAITHPWYSEDWIKVGCLK